MDNYAIPTQEKLVLALRALEFTVWLAEDRGAAPSEEDDPDVIARWEAARKLAEKAYEESSGAAAESLQELAESRPGLFLLACRLQGYRHTDPRVEGDGREALWRELAEPNARELLERFLEAA